MKFYNKKLNEIFQSGIPNYFSSNFIYKRIPVYDLATTNLLQYATQITSFIAKGLHHGSVFVHCKKGKSRSSTCVLFYLMEKRRYDLKHALQLIKSKRECVDPIPAFLDQAKEYENRLISDGIKLSEAGVDVQQKSSQQSHTVECKKHVTESKKRKLGPSIGPLKGPATGLIRGPTRGPNRCPGDLNEDKHSKRRKHSDAKQYPQNTLSREKKNENNGANIGPSLPRN